MKKLISVFLCAILVAASVFCLSGCSGTEELNCEVVLITDGGTVSDGSYNESAWSGVTEFANSEGLNCRYYQPTEMTTETVSSYIELAVNNGAEYIVLPTDAFEVAVYENAQKYRDVKFLLIDGIPHAEGDTMDAYFDNVMCIAFDERQSGFLAGYNAVISGNTELGYFGSFYSAASSNYGAGFMQGAAYAADQLGIPVTLDYADYDSPLLSYDYSFTIVANYEKLDNITDKTYVINVVNGSGSGTYTEGSNVTLTAAPAPEGMVFDHWDVQSDTDGVKDKKVNLSTKKKNVTNLLVEKCDATITAVYAEAEGATYPVIVKTENGAEDYSVQYLTAGSSCEISAPVAEIGMVFDHWEISTTAEDAIDDVNAKTTWVHIAEDNAQGITLTPVYAVSKTPTFNVTVVTGEGGNGESTGSGSYITGDTVSVEAAVPMEGYIFTHWSNADANGYGTGISMENEYYPSTSFTMVNRYQSIAETMYDNGVTMIYAGGSDEISVVSEATWKYNFQVQAIGAENYQSGWTHYYSTTIKDYGKAVVTSLSTFRGGYTLTGNCENECISMTYVADENLESYNAIYAALADGSIKPLYAGPGADVRQILNSNCLTLNYWVVN